MTGEVVSCRPPTLGSDSPYPRSAKGTVWRCDCGATWKAGEFKWRVLGWRGRRSALRSHLRWLAEQRRLEALNPSDRAWLASMQVNPDA